jgi:dephospho-CoA kinase
MLVRRFLITGDAGSGKSTLAVYLQTHNYNVIDADQPNFSHWVERATNRCFATRPDKTADSLNKFDWVWKKKAIQKALTQQVEYSSLFLCGVSHNQATFYSLFDKIFLLWLDTSTIIQRLTSRTNNPFGKSPGDLEAVLGWHDEFQNKVQAAGAIVIDGNQSVSVVAQQILEFAKVKNEYQR